MNDATASHTWVSRKRGKVERACDVYVSRSYKGGGWALEKSKWAIPFELASLRGEKLFTAYAQHLVDANLTKDIHELAYQTLGCWCKDAEICHTRVLRTLVQEFLDSGQPTATATTDATDNPKLHIERQPLYRAGKVRSEPLKKLHAARAPQALKRRPRRPRSPRRLAVKKSAAKASETEGAASPTPRRSKTNIEGAEGAREAKACQAKACWDDWLVDGKISRVPIASVPMEALIYQPIIVRRHWREPPFNWKTGDPPPTACTTVNSKHLTVVYEPMEPYPKPPAFDAAPYVECVAVLPKPTAKLSATVMAANSKWPPLVCYVARVTRNKATKRFTMILSETPSAKASNDNSIRVEVASQLDRAIANGAFSKDDLVRVKDYAVSTLGRRKHILMCHATKYSL